MKEKEKEKERARLRATERDKKREKERERERQKERERERHTQRERERETKREKEREIDRETEREKHTERERETKRKKTREKEREPNLAALKIQAGRPKTSNSLVCEWALLSCLLNCSEGGRNDLSFLCVDVRDPQESVVEDSDKAPTNKICRRASSNQRLQTRSCHESERLV